MTVTRTQFLSLMEPILRSVETDKDYQRPAPIYPSFYDMIGDSRKRKETYFDYAGLGDFSVKNEGGAVTFTDPIAGAELAMTHVRFSNGYKVTQEMLDHDQFGEIRTLEQDLRLALNDFLDVRGHLLLNNGFGTTNAAGFLSTDFRSEGLFSTSHTRIDGGAAQANKPSSDVSLGWSALADAVNKFSLWKDNRGRVIRSEPSTLIVHPNDTQTAMELLQSTGKPGTANNDTNALRGVISNVVVSPFLTDTNAWFIKGGNTRTVWHWDVRPRFGAMEDWDLEVIRRKVVLGFSHGHLGWVGWYGSSGT